MTTYTHIYEYDGSEGYPVGGDDVLVEGECGWHTIMTVQAVSDIMRDGQYGGSYVLLACAESDTDYGVLSQAEQDAAWEDMRHVGVLES